MMRAARNSTFARCVAGALRHTPDSKVSRARATAASTAAWLESGTSAICSSLDGLKTAMALLNILHPFTQALQTEEPTLLI